MKPSLFIRADATGRIGTGHIMRCLALAQFWKYFGGDVTFLSHCESGVLQQRIMDEGFGYISIERAHPDFSDLEYTLHILEKSEVQKSGFQDWVVLDGYHFTPDYQKAIRKNGHRLMVIDDMAHLNHYSADILLNQNINAPTLKYSCDRDTVQLLGCEYVLLRREFRQFKNRKKQIPERVKKILVTMGGADPDNVTLKVVKALNSLNDPDLEVQVVVGPSNPNTGSLEKELSISPFNSHLLRSVKNMPELMAWADLAVSAGGSTCWELAFMGLPSIIMTLADNQLGISQGLAKAGVGIDLGWHEDISIGQCAQLIERTLKDRKKRICLSEQGQKLITGRSVVDITKTMLVGQIKLRRVQENDCEQLWRWANDPEVRRSAFSAEEIARKEHKAWFLRKLGNPDCIQYIALSEDGNPIGQIRFDIKNSIAEIDYSIDRTFRYMGLGKTVLKNGVELFCAERAKPVIIQGRVKKRNEPSRRVFESVGFFEVGEKVVDRSDRSRTCIVYQF